MTSAFIPHSMCGVPCCLVNTPSLYAGGMSMVMEGEDDEDDDMQLLTGAPPGRTAATAALAAAGTPGFVPSLAQLAMLHPSNGQPMPSHPSSQHRLQQQQQQVTPGSGVTPASDTVSMSSATPNFDHLLRPALQQPFAPPPGPNEGASGFSWLTPESADGGTSTGRGHVGGRGVNAPRTGRGRSLAAALFASPPDSSTGSPTAAAGRAGGRGGRGSSGGVPAAPSRPSRRPDAVAAAARGAAQHTAAHAAAGVDEGDVTALVAATGADRATAAAALAAAGGDMMHAAAQIGHQQQQQRQRARQ